METKTQKQYPKAGQHKCWCCGNGPKENLRPVAGRWVIYAQKALLQSKRCEPYMYKHVKGTKTIRTMPQLNNKLCGECWETAVLAARDGLTGVDIARFDNLCRLTLRLPHDQKDFEYLLEQGWTANAPAEKHQYLGNISMREASETGIRSKEGLANAIEAVDEGTWGDLNPDDINELTQTPGSSPTISSGTDEVLQLFEDAPAEKRRHTSELTREEENELLKSFGLGSEISCIQIALRLHSENAVRVMFELLEDVAGLSVKLSRLSLVTST